VAAAITKLLTVYAILPSKQQLGITTVCALPLPRAGSTRYSVSRFTLHTPPYALVTIKLVPSTLYAFTARFAEDSHDICHACKLVILAESRTLCANRRTHTIYRSAAQCFSELQRAQSSRLSGAVMQAFQQYFHEEQATLTLSAGLPKFD
jgi:hypothetical protein